MRVVRQVMRSIPTRANEIFNNFIYLRSRVIAKSVGEFRYSNAITPEFGGKWGAVCLNTRLPLPTLLYNRKNLIIWTSVVVGKIGYI